MLPADLVALIEQIRGCERVAERLIADLDDAAVNHPAPGGGWSVAQCLQHLVLMNAFYLRGWRERVEAARERGAPPFAGLHPTLPGRWFVRSMEPPYRMKGKAVDAATPPARVARDGLLEAYCASHDEYRALVHAAAGTDVNRVVGPNAILPSVRMRASTVLLVIPAHDRRHLWQAERVRRALSGA